MLEKMGLVMAGLAIFNYIVSLYAYWMCRTFDALLYAIYAILFAVVCNGIKD